MLQPSLLLMISLNKTETSFFLSVVCSLFPRAIVLTFIYNMFFVSKGNHIFLFVWCGITRVSLTETKDGCNVRFICPKDSKPRNFETHFVSKI